MPHWGLPCLGMDIGCFPLAPPRLPPVSVSAASNANLQLAICILMWSSCVMWLFFYCGSWSFIEHHIWREESRRRRWGEDCKELFSKVLTPNLGWALEALEIDTLEGLTLREAQSAFHRLAKRYHPDVTGQARASAEQFKDLNEAYDAIKQHLQSASATV